MPERDYTNHSQQLLLAIIEHMAPQPFQPVTVQALTQALNTSRDRVFRSLWNLETAQLIERARTSDGYILSTRWLTLTEPMRGAVTRMTASATT